MHEKNEEPPLRVAFYIRVSSEEQVKKGYGIEYQTQDLLDLVQHKSRHNNWITDPKWHFTDPGCTGTDLNRPAYQKMMEQAKKGAFDLIAVWKIDRLSRDLSHLLKTFEQLKQFGVSFYSLKENVDFSGPIGRLTFQIFGALAEFERETIRARSAEGRLAAARAGKYTGGNIPYGYDRQKSPDKGSELVLVYNEAKWVKQMFDWFVYDRINYLQIAARLNDLDLPKGIGAKIKGKKTKWNDHAIKKMLTNPTYVGARQENITDSDGDIQKVVVPTPRIIDDVTFFQSQNIVREIESDTLNRGGGKKYMLSRLITDITTGRNFVGYTRQNGSYGYRRKSFMDSDGIKHRNQDIPAAALEDYVWELILLAIDKPEDFYRLYQRQNMDDTELTRLKETADLLQQRIDQLKRKAFKVNDSFFEGQIAQTDRDNHIQQIDRSIGKAEKELVQTEQLISQLAEQLTSQKAIEYFAKNFEKNIEQLTYEQKCLLVKICVKKVEVQDAEDELKITVFFAFVQPNLPKNQGVVEPENVLSVTNKDNLDGSSQLHGAELGKGYMWLQGQNAVLVPLHRDYDSLNRDHICLSGLGYARSIFVLAFSAVNIHLISAPLWLRWCSQAAISLIRLFRHWPRKTPISISTMLSQLACLGVKWNCSCLSTRLASAAGKAL